MTQHNVRAALILATVAMGWMTPFAMADTPPLHGLNEVNHAKVELKGGFWGPRLKTHHEVTVPHALNCLEADGHVTNFDKAAGVYDGPLRGHHAFDSDLYKALEGALYSLQHFKDPELHKRVDNILDRIVAAQQEDGFLISYFIVNNDLERWGDMRPEHQLYNTGHFFEMAVENKESLPIRLNVNGEKTEAMPKKDGYVHLQRQWKPGDTIELDLPVPVRRVYSHEDILANHGKVSLMRGPIVYCFEAVDNPGVDFSKTILPNTAGVQAEHRTELLGGLTVLQTKGLDDQNEPITLTAIPYYAWTNRENGPMTVWINETPASK